MSGSTQAQIVQVEDLLRNVGVTITPQKSDSIPRTSSRSFDSRPAIAACFAIFVFAPGCAAATVFLMRADGTVPPITAPDGNPPFVTRSDRLPVGQWSTEAARNSGALDSARLATAAAFGDPDFPSPILIRGSLEDGTLTTFAEPMVMPVPIMLPSKPRLKRDVGTSHSSSLPKSLNPSRNNQPSLND